MKQQMTGPGSTWRRQEAMPRLFRLTAISGLRVSCRTIKKPAPPVVAMSTRPPALTAAAG